MFKTKKKIIVTAAVLISVIFGLIVYFILIASGVINLLGKNLIFTSGSAEMIYDEQSTLVCHEYELAVGSLYYGHYMKVDYLSELDTIGEIDNEIVVTIYDANHNIVSSKYEITYVYGTLKMNSVPLKISTASDEKTYDENPLMKNEWDLLSGILLDGHRMEVNVIGSQTLVGKSDNDFILTVFDERNIDVSNLYQVDKELGTLEVRPRYVSVVVFGDSKVYDGTPLTKNEYLQVTSVLSGHTINVIPTGTITDVGVVENNAYCSVTDGSGNDVTYLYDIIVTSGVLVVTQATVHITTATDFKTFDGDPLSKIEYTVTGILDMHYSNVKMESTITNVGKIDNDIILQIYDIETKQLVLENYNFKYDLGYLEVYPATITIKTADDSTLYDGEDFFNVNDSVITGLPQGYQASHNDDFTSINTPQSILNIMTYSIYYNGENVSDNFIIDYKYGTLVIEKIYINVITKDYNVEYDGESHDLNDLKNNTFDLSGIIDSYSTEFVGEYEYAGSVYNKLVISFVDPIAANYYNFEYNYGVVTVAKKAILIITGSDDKIYDEEEFSCEKYTSSLEEHSDIFMIDNFRVVKEIGSYDNTADISLFDSQNYELTIVWGGLTISPEDKIALTITPKSIVVPVGGTVSANGYYSSSSNLIGLEALLSSGFTYNAAVSGSISSIGFVSTQITSFVLYDQASNVVAMLVDGQIESEIYIINVNSGVLSMTNVTITATSAPVTKDYDGISLTVTSANVTGAEELPAGYKVVLVGTIINAGSLKPSVQVLDDSDNDVTSHYYIENNLGTLTINAVNISFDFGIMRLPELTEYTDEKIENVSYTDSSGFIGSVEAYLTVFTGEQYSNITISSSNIRIKILDLSGNDITKNFNITISGYILVE